MNKFIFALLAFGLLAGAAASQPIIVRSGEHGGFTRLVFRVPAQTGWDLEQSGRLLSLSIDLPTGVIDSSDVFRRIGRDRLQSISQPGPGAAVDLALSCDCFAVARMERGGLLVVDIRPSTGVRLRNAGLPWLPADRRYRFELGGIDRETLPAPTPFSLSRPRSQIERPVAATELEPNIGMELVEARLLDQITRAASQGLVKPGASPLRRPPESERPTRPVVSEPDEPETSPQPASIGISAVTAADRDRLLSGPLQADGPVGVECLDDSLLDIQNWGDERPFGVQISDARSGLTTEFDVVTEQSALHLARTYLFFGFGAEARSVLAIVPTTDRRADVMHALAAVLDNENSAKTALLQGQMGCNSDVAFWSLMASDSQTPQTHSANLNAAKRAFVSLPPHLRGYLGPEFGRRLIRHGDTAGGEEILLSLSRADLPGDDAASLVRAELDAQIGDFDEALSGLNRLAQSPSDQAPEALIQLVETAWQSRGSVPPETVDLLAAYRTERRGTPEYARLLSAQALALALQGNFEPAFALSDDLGADALPADLVSRLASLLTRRGDDLSFLSRALEDPRGLGAMVTEADRPEYVRRLLALGFPQAAALAMRATELQVIPQRRLINAEIALALGRPHQAIAGLSGVEGEPAARLRSRAMLSVGELGQAADDLMAAGDIEAAARVRWQAGDHPAAMRMEGTDYAHIGQLSQLLSAPMESVPEQVTLAGARTQLDESATTRRLVGELFEALESVSPP